MSLNHFDSRIKHSCIRIYGELAYREFSSYGNNVLKGIVLLYWSICLLIMAINCFHCN